MHRECLPVQHRCTFAQFGNDIFSCHFAAFYVVGSDVSCYFTFISGAVDGNNRNLCLVGCQNGVRNSCRVYRVYDEDRDISLEQVGNIIGLLSRVILASTIFTFTPALSAAAFTLLAIVTKKGLFWVETEKPMVTFLEPEAAPSAFLSEEPQPAAEMRAAPIRAANAIFFNNLFPP